MSHRIGLVCPYSFSHPGGVQNHVIGLAGWLRSQGHSVNILAPSLATAESLRLNGLSWADFTSAGPAFPVLYNGSVARINFGPLEAARVRKWLRRGRFDVIHIHEPVTPSVAVLALWLADAPVVATFHTATPGSGAMRLANRFMPGTIELLDVGIAVSTIAHAVVKEHLGLDPMVIGNGLRLDGHDIATHDPAQGPWRNGAVPRVTFVGRHGEPRKGFDVLMAALPQVRAVHPDLAVSVIGSGTPGGEPGVEYEGFCDDSGRNERLGRSDALVVPALGRESFGIVLIEGLASGAPLVASDLPAFREVLTDDQGVVGHLAAPGDSDDLARAIIASLAEPRDLRFERGRRRAAQYDWSAIGPQVVRRYEEAIAHGTHRGRLS